MIRLATTAPVEIAHLSPDGVMHGHSLTVEAWTDRSVDLDEWHSRLVGVLAGIEGQLEVTIAARTFEDVAEAVLSRLEGCTKIVLRLPTRGHVVEVTR